MTEQAKQPDELDVQAMSDDEVVEMQRQIAELRAKDEYTADELENAIHIAAKVINALSTCVTNTRAENLALRDLWRCRQWWFLKSILRDTVKGRLFYCDGWHFVRCPMCGGSGKRV
jgi:hypothetical protein